MLTILVFVCKFLCLATPNGQNSDIKKTKNHKHIANYIINPIYYLIFGEARSFALYSAVSFYRSRVWFYVLVMVQCKHFSLTKSEVNVISNPRKSSIAFMRFVQHFECSVENVETKYESLRMTFFGAIKKSWTCTHQALSWFPRLNVYFNSLELLSASVVLCWNLEYVEIQFENEYTYRYRVRHI